MFPSLQSLVEPPNCILSNRTTHIIGFILKVNVIFIIIGNWEMILLYSSYLICDTTVKSSIWVSQLWDKHIPPKRRHEYRIVHKGLVCGARSPGLWECRQITCDSHVTQFLACQVLPITELASLRPIAVYISKLQD